MQEYLYYKNNKTAMEKQEEEQRRIKKLMKAELARQALLKSAPKSKGLGGTQAASEAAGFSPNVQAAVNYANRQLQQKIKT